MKGTTHLASGLAIAGLIQPLTQTPVAFIGIVIGSILPDIDSHTSTLGQHIPIIPRILKHRGITHSLIFLALCYILTPYLAIGVGIHLTLDFLNPKGIPLFWPVSKSIRIPFISKLFPSGGVADKLMGACLWMLTIFLYFLLFGSFQLSVGHDQ